MKQFLISQGSYPYARECAVSTIFLPTEREAGSQILRPSKLGNQSFFDGHADDGHVIFGHRRLVIFSRMLGNGKSDIGVHRLKNLVSLNELQHSLATWFSMGEILAQRKFKERILQEYIAVAH